MPKRLLELDVLRGLAVIAVIACHYTNACRELGHMASSFRLGSYGPHLFFIISGFVIFLTLRKTETARDFVVSRFSRLFPVYWVAVLVAFVSLHWFPLPGESVTLRQAAVNLTMLQTWLRVPDVDVSYWTLGVELKFYALMLGLFALGLLRRIDLVLGVWLTAILAYWTSVETMGLPIPHAVATPLNVYFGQLFIAGIVFYLLKFDRPTAYRHALLACCLIAQAAIGGLESALIVAGFFALFYAFAYDRLGWIVSRPLVFLGSISYALYVLHHPLGNVVMINLRHVTGSPVLLIGAAVGVTVLASMAVTRYVEKPAMASIRRFDRKRRASAGLGPRGQFVMFNCPRLSRWHMSEIHRAS